MAKLSLQTAEFQFDYGSPPGFTEFKVYLLRTFDGYHVSVSKGADTAVIASFSFPDTKTIFEMTEAIEMMLSQKGIGF